MPGFAIASANGLAFCSTLFSLGRSAATAFDSCELLIFASEAAPVVFAGSKLIFCEKLESSEILSFDLLLLGGGDCDRCDGESGAVMESSSAFDIIP